MKDHMSEIVVGIIGATTTYVGWVLGGRQHAKNSKDDTLTRGADMIVESSQKLLLTLEKMLQEEREHRQTCETQLRQITKKVDELEIKLRDLEK